MLLGSGDIQMDLHDYVSVCPAGVRLCRAPTGPCAAARPRHARPTWQYTVIGERTGPNAKLGERWVVERGPPGDGLAWSTLWQGIVKRLKSQHEHIDCVYQQLLLQTLLL